MNLYHVDTIHGDIYAVTATTWRSAMSFVADWLRTERPKDTPIRVRHVGESPDALGTVRLWQQVVAVPSGDCAICAEHLRRWTIAR
ncbi:MAG: hypothetical protein KGL39_49010, partial [Patescibacteria group bacterium]|nr:hypothetical protein [Patescibacteria group bacterium]